MTLFLWRSVGIKGLISLDKESYSHINVYLVSEQSINYSYFKTREVELGVSGRMLQLLQMIMLYLSLCNGNSFKHNLKFEREYI